jgi:hypothetical protein
LRVGGGCLAAALAFDVLFAGGVRRVPGPLTFGLLVGLRGCVSGSAGVVAGGGGVVGGEAVETGAQVVSWPGPGIWSGWLVGPVAAVHAIPLVIIYRAPGGA